MCLKNFVTLVGLLLIYLFLLLLLLLLVNTSRHAPQCGRQYSRKSNNLPNRTAPASHAELKSCSNDDLPSSSLISRFSTSTR